MFEAQWFCELNFPTFKRSLVSNPPRIPQSFSQLFSKFPQQFPNSSPTFYSNIPEGFSPKVPQQMSLSSPRRCVVPRPSATSAATVAPEESKGLYLAESLVSWNHFWVVVTGAWILWLFILGMSSSQLANSFYFFIYWECHHPNWRTHIFQRGRAQPPTIPTKYGQKYDMVLTDLQFRKPFGTGDFSHCPWPLLRSVLQVLTQRQLSRQVTHENTLRAQPFDIFCSCFLRRKSADVMVM